MKIIIINNKDNNLKRKAFECKYALFTNTINAQTKDFDSRWIKYRIEFDLLKEQDLSFFEELCDKDQLTIHLVDEKTTVTGTLTVKEFIKSEFIFSITLNNLCFIKLKDKIVIRDKVPGGWSDWYIPEQKGRTECLIEDISLLTKKND